MNRGVFSYMQLRRSTVATLTLGLLAAVFGGCSGGAVSGTTGTFRGPVTIGGDADVAGGGLFGVTTIVNGSTGSFLINDNVNRASNMALSNMGSVKFRGSISGASEASAPTSFVAPVYTPSGKPVPSTLHGVVGSCTLSGGSCSVKLTGVAAFRSPASYACTFDYASGASDASGHITNVSGSAVVFAATNYSGPIAYTCTGT